MNDDKYCHMMGTALFRRKWLRLQGIAFRVIVAFNLKIKSIENDSDLNESIKLSDIDIYFWNQVCGPSI